MKQQIIENPERRLVIAFLGEIILQAMNKPNMSMGPSEIPKFIQKKFKVKIKRGQISTRLKTLMRLRLIKHIETISDKRRKRFILTDRGEGLVQLIQTQDQTKLKETFNQILNMNLE